MTSDLKYNTLGEFCSQQCQAKLFQASRELEKLYTIFLIISLKTSKGYQVNKALWAENWEGGAKPREVVSGIPLYYLEQVPSSNS